MPGALELNFGIKVKISNTCITMRCKYVDVQFDEDQPVHSVQFDQKCCLLFCNSGQGKITGNITKRVSFPNLDMDYCVLPSQNVFCP